MSDRKFDTWEWRDSSVCAETFKIEVRIIQPENIAKGPIQFRTKLETPPLSFVADHPEALRQKVDRAIRDFFAIAWRPMIKVRFLRHVAQDEARFSWRVTYLDVGIWRDGTLVYRDQPGQSGAGPHTRIVFQKHEERSKAWEDEQLSNVIEDTPENRKALEELLAVPVQVMDNLHALFGEEAAKDLFSKTPLGQAKVCLLQDVL